MSAPSFLSTAVASGAPARSRRTLVPARLRRAVLALGLVGLAALPALVVPLPARAETVRGSGQVATVQRALPLLPSGQAPEAIAVEGPLRVELVQGSGTGVTLVGDANLLPLVETRLQGRSLHIGPRDEHELAATQPIRVRVVLPALGLLALGGDGRVEARDWRTPRLQVAIGGSGGVTLSGLDAPRLDVNIGGSGDIIASGKGGDLDLTIGGSGAARLAGYAVERGRVTVAGSGSAEVQAQRALSVTIAGSGQVLQTGAAEPRSSIVGSGRVARR